MGCLLQYLIFALELSPWLAHAQPSPALQKRITEDIEAAADATELDYTAFVNPFIGTANFGNVCPGASLPFGMVKFSTDMTGYAPAGYVANASEFVRGLSPLHDSGTGSSLGTYGNFEVMPVLCPGGFETCTTSLNARQRLRKPFTDDGAPGYFTLTLDNDIKMEATATRRAGLERFTFPPNTKPYFVLDMANDLPASFAGGELLIHPDEGRITIGGRYGSSFGPGRFNYQAFACYDLLDGGKQKLEEYGVWTADNYGLDAKGLGLTRLNLSLNLIGGIYQSGALFSLIPEDPETNELNIRVGISFRSVDQACANAEEEIGSASFAEIRERARVLWQEKLSRIEIDVPGTPPNITQMFYSSLYRSFLTPNNATGESQGVFADTTSPYFDSLYCSWDTFRTFFPLLGLHSPEEYAEIVETYIDGWRKHGWMPECRANNLQGWTQGGTSADNIVGHFVVHYHNEAERLGIDVEEAYRAMVTDAEVNPPEWNIQGRQINVYKQYGYVPFAVLDTSSTGRQTREGSRTLEYAFEDFAIRQVAQLLERPDDVEKYTNMSLFYRNIWDETVESDGFKGFFQKRYPNGTFAYTDPTNCSPKDKNETRPCSLQGSNTNGFYESSSWEYSFFAPHDTAYLIDIMGGNETFVKRLDHFFDEEYYLAGNEPSFQTPIGYHYADRPTKSVQRVREVVFQNFGVDADGLPGNDDQAAMATLLAFHILGLYPIPSTTQYLVLSPMVPKYTIHTPFLNVSTTVRVVNYDPKSVAEKIPPGAAAYVKDVSVIANDGSVRWSTETNGTATVTPNPSGSRCHLDFYDTFRLGGEIVITLTPDTHHVDSCGGTLPDSISTGGWSEARR
ncbi:glycosyl hydrolase [Coprinopsis cinerea okayama7|uniref:Glycosyl hydrolase n=1 Tax=Coprinopsis cinerea (strain Okayama-7 / 130 / ATCC MYA-4618 / FGSC 9003) TaxID=240176 RepID=A8N7I9_COPC7|nr:glycosyl hydrolase [Coprinopsis cinerea okayama7\|eukprot:XP_001830795.2 glycosyl hydrolase [Coprinopsis cinerea okayama7\